MKRYCGIIIAVVAISLFLVPLLHAQRFGAVTTQVDIRPLLAARGHLVGLQVDPDSGTVRILSRQGRAVINPDFSMVSATCLNCGGGCPPISRSVDVVLQAVAAVPGGYGVSGLTSANYTMTNVGYSTQSALAVGQQVTITITGDVLDCSTSFNVYFNICDSTPANWGDSCPVSFGPVGVLNTNAGSDSGSDSNPQVTIDGRGNWITVWRSNENLGGTIGTDADIFVSRSTNEGTSWTPPAPLNTNAWSDSGNDYYPQVTTDGVGNWLAVWNSDDNLGGTIGTDADIFVARSTDDGASWTAPVPLNSNAGSDSGSDYNPQVTTDGTGNWVAVWHSYDNLGGTVGTDSDIFVARSTDDGASWTAPVALNTNAGSDSGSDQRVQVTTDGAGNWVAVWHSYDNLGGTIGTDADIFVSRSTDNGVSWTAPAVLNTNAGSDSGDDKLPQVTTDSVGNWVTVWYSYENLGGTVGTDSDIFVARSTDNGASWTVPATLNTNAGGDSGYDAPPQVTTDGKGNWLAVWFSNENLGGSIGTDSDIFIARSTDDGASWTAPVALNTNAGSDSGSDSSPQLTTDGSGNWVAVWDSNENLGGSIGTDYDIFVALGK